MADTNVIKFARRLAGWTFELDDPERLVAQATLVRPEEYLPVMRGEIFCPECSAPLYRSPQERDMARNGRVAYFAHSRSYDTRCSLRVQRAPGWSYENEELAREAIERGDLVVVDVFQTAAPRAPAVNEPGVWDHDPNEDENGPVVERAIPRHHGDEMHLPARAATVRGLVRRLDRRWHSYYWLPGHAAPQPLHRLITPAHSIRTLNPEKSLIVGRITHAEAQGRGNPWNLRMLFVEYPNLPAVEGQEWFKDFCMKVTVGEGQEKGIDANSVGRLILVYGAVTASGMGLCVTQLGWGEFALVPQQYDGLFVGL